MFDLLFLNTYPAMHTYLAHTYVYTQDVPLSYQGFQNKNSCVELQQTTDCSSKAKILN